MTTVGQAVQQHRFQKWMAATACTAALCMAWGAARAQPEPAVTMPAEKVKPAPAVTPAEVGKPLPAQADDGAPLVRTDMRHRCGGIGSDESTAMRAEMKNHPLSLLFAQEGGAYMANVDVTIRSPAGQPSMVFRADGPVCLIDLPAGKYEIQAARGANTQRQSVTVGGGAKTVDFRFP
ncbi:carboxypeptidase regulatory-like domain-containing protein [Variovorax dokdonensis]|uniref:Carboxypeptidase regulatory-like domain-containing protein n=1 Tax=Variovorax dokdonensis TaxID=344883 RepID=A0ABT7NF88_9BURK|nr:carboxypeptidase regulatory-like domain-containing protein [Variovorax dokdonensis]MDM0046618.1 carboxypeptidase regulatory-like domain-containing protein [Variovorax dokdonensis]